MGTVHLSLPESLHQELRDYAAEMGVQVTDLIKMFIKEGLEKLRKERMERARRQQEQATQLLIQLMAKIEKLQSTMEERFTMIEGDLYRLRGSLQSLKKRVDRLEDIVEERIMPVEPELISP